jgi:outer membrane protein TolC
VLLLLAPLVQAQPPVSEAELLQRFLDTPEVERLEAAAAARGLAEGSPPPALPNPEIEARHEAGAGTGASTTDVLGGALSIDLGFAAVAEARAARFRREAGEHRRRARVLQEACAFRNTLAELWLLDRRAAALERGEGRLRDLVEGLEALRLGDEVAGWAVDRAMPAWLTLRAESGRVEAEGEGLRRALSVLLDLELGDAPGFEAPDPGPLEPLQTELGARHPELLAARATFNATLHALGAARAHAVPDLRVFAGARWDSTADQSPELGYEVGGSLELPLSDWGTAPRRHAAAERLAAEAELMRLERSIGSRIESAWIRLRHAGALPPREVDADALWSAGLARYGSGEGDLDELLNLATELAGYETAMAQARHDRRAAWLELSCATGTFLEPELRSILEERTP